MATVSEVLNVLEQLFGSETQAKVCSSQFCRRRSKLCGQSFVQGLVFGWLSNPQARVCDLASAIGCTGVLISPQALQQRFNERSAALLHEVIGAAIRLQLMGRSAGGGVSLPGGFKRVWVQDGTTVALPDELREQWPGGSGQAALKIEVCLDLQSGALSVPLLVPGRAHDLKAAQEQPAPQPDELYIADLGYFCLARFQSIDQAGGFFLSRLKVGTHVTLQEKKKDKEDKEDKEKKDKEKKDKEKKDKEKKDKEKPLLLSQRLNALPSRVNQVEWDVVLGSKTAVRCRLVAVRVPPAVAAQRRVALEKEARRKGQSLSQERWALCDWTLLVTNAPPQRLNQKQALVLYGARWQIECLFRLWKETLGLTRWRALSAARILCEVYAKLLAAWVGQVLLQQSLWHNPQRSLTKAIRCISSHALLLLHALVQKPPHAFLRALQTMLDALPKTAITQKKAKKPATFQRLIEVL